jgi:hypothetical protein
MMVGTKGRMNCRNCGADGVPAGQHYPDFQNGAFQQRNRSRVDRLFQILRESATPLNLGDSGRTGAGVPDAVLAFTARPGGGGAAPTSGGGDIMAELLKQLREDLVAAGLLR